MLGVMLILLSLTSFIHTMGTLTTNICCSVVRLHFFLLQCSEMIIEDNCFGPAQSPFI